MSRELTKDPTELLDTSQFPEDQAKIIRSQISGVTVLRPVATVMLEDFVSKLIWSRNGKFIFGSTSQGQMAELNSVGLERKSAWRAHSHGLSDFASNHEGSLIATGGQDGKIGRLKIWERQDNTFRLVSENPTGAHTTEIVKFSPECDSIVTGSGKFMKVWDTQGQLVQEYQPLKSTISGIEWRGSKERIATSSYGGIHLWDVSQQNPKRHFEWKGSLISMEISRNGKWIAGGCQDQSVHIWKATSGEDLEMSGYPFKVKPICWSEDNRYLATGGGADITVWDFSGKGPAGSKPIVRSGHVDMIMGFAFRPKHTTQFASIARDGAFFLWDLSGDRRPLALGVRTEKASALAWSPDGKNLVVGYESGEVCLWDVEP